jgi:hypothetical protein
LYLFKINSIYSYTIFKGIIPFLFFYSLSNIFASPQFPEQEIIDDTSDWIDLNSRNSTSAGDRYTDIVSIDYFSDGKSFNSTIWLLFPFKESPNRQYVDYGMYIDSDFDPTTGFGGIDYKIEIQWNNSTRQWNKVIESWSPYGKTKVLYNATNYKNFYETLENYVTLSFDLDQLLNPKKYKILFYAETKKEEEQPYLVDFTRWVAIPPPQLIVSTSPNSIDLIPGQKKTIEVRVNSSAGYEPTVNLFTQNRSNEILSSFLEYNRLRIPSYGMATTPLTIATSPNSNPGPYTLFIFANTTFPAEELIKPRVSNMDYKSSIPSENIITQSTMLITIKEPPSFLDQLSNFWDKSGGFLSFFYGIIIGITPFIYKKLKK